MTITLTIPAPCGTDGKPLWLSANQRLHWAPKANITKQWRQLARLLAGMHGLPTGLDRVHITATIHKTNGRAYDVHNLVPTCKAIVDGLVDYGLIQDDDNSRLTGPDMRAGEKNDGASVVLTITPLPDGPDCD